MLSFKKIKLDKKDQEKELITTLTDLLQVWDHNHDIIICNINDIYKDFNPNDFSNWSNTLPMTIFDRKKQYRSSTPEITKSWQYIQKQIQEEEYIAIVELDPSQTKLVRGIIKGNKKEIEVAMNPTYQEYKPTTIEEKYKRLLTDYTLYIDDYLKTLKSKKTLIK